MLMRTDPFRDLDRLTQQLLGAAVRPAAMPMDAYRSGDHFIAEFDLPGVDPDSIDVEVEHNNLTVRAERPDRRAEDREMVAAERPTGTFTRQLLLGETLDTAKVEASYDAGVLTVRIPIAEQAKPRRVSISSNGAPKSIRS